MDDYFSNNNVTPRPNCHSMQPDGVVTPRHTSTSQDDECTPIKWNNSLHLSLYKILYFSNGKKALKI